MDEKLKIIIGLLIKKTRVKEVTWKQVDDNAYVVNFIDNRIVINNYFTSFRERKKVNLLIYNSKNEIINSISEDQDRDVKELYKLANDNYYNIDDTMNSIIQALM